MQLATEPLSEFEQTLQDAIDRQEDLTEARIHGANNDYEMPEVETVKDPTEMQALEFMEIYKSIPLDTRLAWRELYRSICAERDKQTARLAELKSEMEIKNIDIEMFKKAFKRANNPKKLQQRSDASYAFWCKEFGDNQRDLWE